MDSAKRITKSVNLDVPDVELVCDKWKMVLEKNFEHVIVRVVDSPDLRQWGLSAIGISGNVEVADIGSPLNVERKNLRNHRYAFEEIASICGRKDSFMYGAGATSPNVSKINAELMPNTNLKSKEIRSHFTKINESNTYETASYNSNEFGGLCNVGICDGKPGKVLEVRVKQRRGEKNFVDVLADGLLEVNSEKQISCCGVFKVLTGKVRAHVMPKFPCEDLTTPEEVNAWLQFFEMEAPLTMLTVFHSRDEHNLGLRLRHTHFFSDGNNGGHYHYDVTANEVDYHGYFTLAEKVTKIDTEA